MNSLVNRLTSDSDQFDMILRASGLTIRGAPTQINLWGPALLQMKD